VTPLYTQTYTFYATSDDGVRDGFSVERDPDHVFARLLDAFAYGLRHFFGFAKGIPDPAFLIAHHH